MGTIFSCPGSTCIKEPIPEFFTCPNCHSEVEIWTHETSRQCPVCGTRVSSNQVPTCVEWCEYGKECVGEEAYNIYMAGKDKEDRGDGPSREEEERAMRELIEKIKEKCERRIELNGKKADNKDQ
jgi:hypothetical protein